MHDFWNDLIRKLHLIETQNKVTLVFITVSLILPYLLVHLAVTYQGGSPSPSHSIFNKETTTGSFAPLEVGGCRNIHCECIKDAVDVPALRLLSLHNRQHKQQRQLKSNMPNKKRTNISSLYIFICDVCSAKYIQLFYFFLKCIVTFEDDEVKINMKVPAGDCSSKAQINNPSFKTGAVSSDGQSHMTGLLAQKQHCIQGFVAIK